MSKWKRTPETSPVWIHRGDKPIESIFLVRNIPERPIGLETKTTWDRNTFPDGQPDEPDPALYLGALEWSWSPMHSRMDSYYLSCNRDYWMIFMHLLEDGSSSWEWSWYLYAIAPKVSGDDRSIGFWMIHDLLKHDAGIHEVDAFHLVSAEGLLTVGDYENIGQLVWTD